MIKLFIFVCFHKCDLYVVFLPDTINAMMLFRKIIKVPIVVSERNNPFSYSDKIQKSMLKSFSKADGIVFQTITAKDFYKKRLKKLPNSIVIPNAIICDIPSSNYNNKEKIIVSVGRFNKQKNFPLLINAFSKITNEFPDYKLYIYGEGDLKEEYKKLVRDLSLEKKVIFPGYVKNVNEFIKDASLFVLPSDYEGIPNALIEAMAIGLPCISTRCAGGGAEFLINNEENGLLVNVGDVNEMALAIKRVLSDNVLSTKISTNAKKISKKLSKNEIYSRWENFLLNINNGKI